MTLDHDEGSLKQGQNLLSGEVLLPRLIVKERALDHNVRRLARYCTEHGVSLAPHAKTTMSPGILRRQAAAGVWGFTVATVLQAQTLQRLGYRRILIANEVVEPRAITWLADAISRDSGFEVLMLVDSLRGVAILDSVLKARPPQGRLGVLIELGEIGKRAGCRTDEEAIQVAAAVRASPHLALAGLEGFEALVTDDAVRPFLRRMRALAVRLIQERYFERATEVIVSAGSSEFLEHSVEELSSWRVDVPVRPLLRPGGYATNTVIPGYQQPLEIWGAVVSRPEPKLAIAGFGRRDVPSDQTTLPEPVALSSNGQVRDITGRAKVLGFYDQHTIVECGDLQVDVGEFLGCSVVSPYRPPFATWKTIPLVDDCYNIVEVLDVLYREK